MLKKILEMLALQDSINTKVNPDWKTANQDWHRAIWIECAEMLEHIGWKWWKNQEPDNDQVKLELVDIWHFLLSMFAEGVTGDDYEAQARAIEIAMSSPEKLNPNKEFLLEDVEDFVYQTIKNRTPNLYLFAGLLEAFGMSFDELYLQYIGKNVLNFFRQDNGYKEGTYQKDWFGNEDNVFLSQLLSVVDPDSQTLAADIRASLESKYQDVLKAAEIEC